MERFTNKYRSDSVTWPSGRGWELAGVVGSGNLEVLLEPTGDSGEVKFVVETSVAGFRRSWEALFERFSHTHAIGGTTVTIHDQGAVPAVVLLRLRQALDNVVGGEHGQ